MQAQSKSVTEIQTECSHLTLEADIRRLRKLFRCLVGGDARLEHLNRVIHPLARALVGIALRRGRAADGERAVVASSITDERMDDVEIGLVARTDQSISKVVGMRAAALSC